MAVVSGTVIATAVVAAVATVLAFYTYFKSKPRPQHYYGEYYYYNSRKPPPPPSPPPAYSYSPKAKSDAGSGRPGSVDSNPTNSSKSRSGSAASRLDDKGFPLGSRRAGSVDSNSTKSSSRSGSSSSKSRSGSAASSIFKCENWSVTSEQPQLDENGFPVCLQSDCCITCGGQKSDVTFFPCGGSYLCKKCAFKFLGIGNYCCKCGLEIEQVSLKAR